MQKNRAVVLVAALLVGCAPQQAETAVSPVAAPSRTVQAIGGDWKTHIRQGENGVLVGKLLAPAPVVWDALLGAMTDRKVKLTILDRATGRMGDTAMVISRSWNNQPLSQAFECGSNMTGDRADQDRIRAVFLAQMSRLAGDTVAVSVHLSGFATPAGSGSAAPCTSKGRAEASLLDDVIRRAGGAGTRK